MDAKCYWIGFNLVKGIGSVRLQGLLDFFGSLEIAWQAPADALRAAGLSQKLVENMVQVRHGADLEQIKSFLDTDIAVYEQKTSTEIGMFNSMAAYAPAYGMIGTIMGLIQVLANMESPETMAAAIAVAFITTLYGVVIANALCIPAAGKLKLRLDYWQTEKEMIIEGICGIRNGDNPKILRERLSPYLIYEPSAAKRKQKGPAENGKENKK